jgi:plastocyanin
MESIMNMKMWCCVVLAVAGGMLCAADGGGLKGTVIFGGDAPEIAPTPVPPNDQPNCKCKEVANETLVVDKTSKGIKWVVVRILDVKGPALPEAAAAPQISQKGCTFTPHVIVIPPGSALDFLNPDAIGHNVHTTPLDFTNPPQNIMQGPQMPVFKYKGQWTKEPELIQVECNLHPWMKGLIVVHDPRYCAVTAADGSFAIKDVPPGKYKIHVFQEKLGEKNLEVEIKAGADADLGQIKFEKK